ncbi:MAG: acetate--CoA ligase family protein [Planctomycetaceae bacterium]|nr:acetate--CoA ligase family protein [Planctomycetaceae bacterium]
MNHSVMTPPTRVTRLDGIPDGKHPLDALLAPRSIAVIGTSEISEDVDRAVLRNLIDQSYSGNVYAVASRCAGIFDLRSYPRVDDVPEPIDLALIIAPAAQVPELVGQCVDVGVRVAIITSSGSRETGRAVAELEREILAEAGRGQIRLLGPKSFGVMNPFLGLNATPASLMAQPGNIAFLSQSGAVCGAVLDWSLHEKIGISALVSLGKMIDIGWGDLIGYLGDDPRTRSIIIHMESIQDPHSFLWAARAVASTKPIIVLKSGGAGESPEADAVLDCAFRRCGVLRVRRLSHLFAMAEVLAKQPRPRGPRLMIVTNGGGPGVLASDALLEGGGVLATPSPETLAALDDELPRCWSHGNPFDLLEDAGPERFARVVERVAADPNADGLLVILSPQPMTDPTQTADRLRRISYPEGKPILASWMGGADVLAGEDLLSRAGIGTFRNPDSASRAFCYLWRYSENLRTLGEATAMPSTDDEQTRPPDFEAVAVIARDARRSGRASLNEIESLRLLSAYGLPTVPTFAAASAEEAVRWAQAIGTSVALKPLTDPDTPRAVAHVSRRDLDEAEAVSRAFAALEELMRRKAGPDHFRGVIVQPMIDLDGFKLFAGSHTDPLFGPVVLFGFGGRLTEVFKDRAYALPPLTPTLARRMMERTRIYRALTGNHGRETVDPRTLEWFLVRLSRLVIEQPWIKQIDINPVLASHDRLLALNARVVVWGPDVPESLRPRPVLSADAPHQPSPAWLA